MQYIFIVNGRDDVRDNILADLNKQLASTDISHVIYCTHGIGDGTRYVRLYSDLHPKDEVCFIACGGCGTLNEVASGVVGFENKTVAYLAYGATNDFCKFYPDHDFHSLKKLLGGEEKRIDIMKVNDNYSINVTNAGFDALVSYTASNYVSQGLDVSKAFSKAMLKTLLGHRVSYIKATVDGRDVNRRSMLSCSMSNCSWYGGLYNVAPYASNDDGLIEFCMLKKIPIVEFLLFMFKFAKGDYMENDFCRKRVIYRRAKDIVLTSKNLIFLSVDGESLAARRFRIRILPKEIRFILPEKS